MRGCALGSIRLLTLDPAAGLTERALTAHAGAVSALAFSSDGTVLASGGGSDSLALWDVQRAARIGPVVPGIQGAAGSLHFTEDGRLLTWPEGGLRAWHASPRRWSELACRIANRERPAITS